MTGSIHNSPIIACTFPMILTERFFLFGQAISNPLHHCNDLRVIDEEYVDLGGFDDLGKLFHASPDFFVAVLERCPKAGGQEWQNDVHGQPSNALTGTAMFAEF